MSSILEETHEGQIPSSLVSRYDGLCVQLGTKSTAGLNIHIK